MLIIPLGSTRRCLPVFGNSLPSTKATTLVCPTWRIQHSLHLCTPLTSQTIRRSHWSCTQAHLLVHLLLMQATAHFNHQMRKLMLSYGTVVSAHYLIVFSLLLAVYRRIFHCIAAMRKKHGWCSQQHSNSTVLAVCTIFVTYALYMGL